MSLWATLMLFGVEFVCALGTVLMGVGFHVSGRVATRLAESERWALRVVAFPTGLAVCFMSGLIPFLGQYALTIPHLMVEPDWQAPDDGDGELLLA